MGNLDMTAPMSLLTPEAESLAFASAMDQMADLPRGEYRRKAIQSYSAFLGPQRLRAARDLLPDNPFAEHVLEECLFAIYHYLPSILVENPFKKGSLEAYVNKLTKVVKAADELHALLTDLHPGHWYVLAKGLDDDQELRKREIESIGDKLGPGHRLHFAVALADAIQRALALHITELPRGSGRRKPEMQALIRELMSAWESLAPPTQARVSKNPITHEAGGQFLAFIDNLLRPIFRPEWANKSFAGFVNRECYPRKPLN